ncbi:helix-turn-helix domain-containing protein [Dactylosporangium sp. NPDC000555]|uniref:winged helix-turn-helix transcriptional regulator n=1 Tax=Dactylosporangium sp. NPDC000555 TaxID=3154260 RepID=UPI00331B0A41
MTKSAEQRRADERIVYDAFLATCPTRQVFATVGDKWAGLVVNALAKGSLRHGELRTRIAGASQKMLTQTLRTLERDGLVTRTVTPSVPVRVDYELTPLGHSLVPILAALKGWSETHIEQILRAREDYDATAAG